jgi:hypothetical protein
MRGSLRATVGASGASSSVLAGDSSTTGMAPAHRGTKKGTEFSVSCRVTACPSTMVVRGWEERQRASEMVGGALWGRGRGGGGGCGDVTLEDAGEVSLERVPTDLRAFFL